MYIKTISSTVTPTRVDKLASVRVNNFMENDSRLVTRIRFLIIAETLLGINRLPVIKTSKLWIFLCHVYSLFLILTWVYYAFTASSGNTFNVMKYSSGLGLIISMFCAAFMQVDPILSISEKMFNIDKTLKITNETNILNDNRSAKCWLVFSVTYCIAECVLFRLYLEKESNPLFFLLYVAMLAQDCDQTFYCALLRTIGFRLKIIKAHIVKTLSPEDTLKSMKKRSVGSMENLASKADLDIKSLLGLYESLHQCSLQVNSLIGVPMTSTFFCSGLSTTLLLMSLIKAFQTTEVADINLKLACLYSIFRSVKYASLVLFPCYWASQMKEYVQVIRTVLHEAINISNLQVLERRKAKIFLQMTRENGFTFALCGVITLNMSTPLSYVSICTTYLVIIIQFSKFFD